VTAALVVPAFGQPPERREVPDPVAEPGRAVLRLRAAGLNPADLAIGGGRFYMPLPDPPFIAGVEAVGEVISSERLAPGTRAWCLQTAGCFADTLSVPDEALVPVPDGLDDALAAALGVAGLAGWMPVRHRGGLATGEDVLVLGASGVAGQVAVQAARLGGAGRVIAAPGRAPEQALAEARDGGVDLVVDMVWGEAAAAAIGLLRPGGRLVQVGNASGPATPITAGPLRGGRLDVRGFSVFSEARDDLAAAYAELAAAALAGDVALEVERVPLSDGAAAWARVGEGTGGRKLVLVPDAAAG
jgi:NADPH2:quinone reductase